MNIDLLERITSIKVAKQDIMDKQFCYKNGIMTKNKQYDVALEELCKSEQRLIREYGDNFNNDYKLYSKILAIDSKLKIVSENVGKASRELYELKEKELDKRNSKLNKVNINLLMFIIITIFLFSKWILPLIQLKLK